MKTQTQLPADVHVAFDPEIDSLLVRTKSGEIEQIFIGSSMLDFPHEFGATEAAKMILGDALSLRAVPIIRDGVMQEEDPTQRKLRNAVMIAIKDAIDDGMSPDEVNAVIRSIVVGDRR